MDGKPLAPHVKVALSGISDVGSVRTNNEDRFLIADVTSGREVEGQALDGHALSDRGTLLVVSDGMGGAEAGEVASRIVVESLREGLFQAPPVVVAEDALRGVVEQVNSEIWDEANSNPKCKGMGATLVAAWIIGSDALFAHVGDSRGYLLRAGHMRQVTRDQSMVESLVEVGMIERSAAESHPQKNVILQAMGARPEVAVAIERVELRRGDFLLFCSDGLSGKVSQDEMRDAILTTATLRDACQRLVDLANSRGGEDNITVVIAELDGDGLPATGLNERMTRTLKSLSEFNFKVGAGYAPPPAHPTHTLGSDPVLESPPSPKVYPPPGEPGTPPTPSVTDPTLNIGTLPSPPKPSDD
ncbi:MAG: Stp1/IreP family PP2C-type Ser/Thr phosphatase [Blastocatellia bacterium]